MATSVEQYLNHLPADRREAIQQVRATVNANLPAGYEEGIQYGVIGWYVPLKDYPDTYNGQPLGIAALASQKHHMALYLNAVYGDPAIETWFRKAFAAAGKKLDMGKSCVRFKTLDALPLDVVGETIARIPVDRFLARYEQVRAETAKRPSARAVRASKTKSKSTSKSKPTSKPKPNPKRR